MIETLSDVMLWRGVPEPIRSDNDPAFLARDLRQWLGKVGTGTLTIEPGSPWENGYCERFNGNLRGECLNGEIFYSLKETQIVIEPWREEDNTRRPYSALNDRLPAPEGCNPFLSPETGFTASGCHVNSLPKSGTKKLGLVNPFSDNQRAKTAATYSHPAGSLLLAPNFLKLGDLRQCSPVDTRYERLTTNLET